MNRRLLRSVYGAAVLMLGALLLAGAQPAYASAIVEEFYIPMPEAQLRADYLALASSAPVVRTDKADYGPGEMAVVTGAGFGANETVTLQVTHTSPVATPGAGHEPWQVSTNVDGTFTSEWFINPDDSRGAAFLLAAAGMTSGLRAEATFTDASAPLSITLTSQEILWLDSNKCNAQGPRGAWLSFVITNTSGITTLTNVTVDFSGFTGTNAAYFKAPADLTRTFLSLAPGATQGAFFYVDYAEVCNHSKGGGSPYTGYTANYTISANAAGYSPAVVRNGTVTTGDLLTTSAAGISQSSVLGLGTYLGQIQTQTVTYSFGNNTDLFFQPAGDAVFPDACIRLVGSEVTGTSGGVTGILGQKNRLAFPTASVPGGGGTITILYTWEINCLSTSVTAHPWAAAKSGNQYKYKGFASSSMVSSSLPTLTVDKSASPVSQTSNGPVTWTVLFTNSAPVLIYLDSISDTIPACMTLANATASGSQVTAPPSGNSFSVPAVGASGTVTWVGNNLGYPIAANSTLTLKYTTNTTNCANGVYTNSATGLLGSVTVGPARASVNIGLPAALGLTKTASPSSFSAAGQSVTYTYVIQNTGTTTPVAGPFTVTDSKPLVVLGLSYAAGAPFPCGAGPLAPGATTSCTATYTTTTADVTAGTITNSATASGSGLTAGPATEMINFSGPALTLTKTPSPPTFQGSGSVITYTYVIKNTGAAVLSGPFSVTDDHIGTPSGTPFTCGSGPLAVGATTSCTATYTVTSGDANTGFVTNTATVSGNGITSNPVQVTVIQAQVPGIAVAKSASPTIYSKDNTTITYTYTVTNTGNTSLSSITISDNHIGNPLGTAFACGSGSLAAGASRTCTATYTTTSADVTAGSVTNSATASGISGSGGNQVTVTSTPATATISVATPVLTMAKSVTETSFLTVGTVLHYSYLVKNIGNVTISGPITISDNKINGGSAFTCGSGDLTVGATVSCSATYTVTQSDLNAGSVTNTASASGTYGGSSVTSPTDNKTVPAIQSPALALTKSVSPPTYTTFGQVVTYTYTVTNTGNVTLIGPFTVTDTKQGTFTCGSGPLVPTSTTSCTSTHTITWSDVTAGSITNSATVSGNGVTSSPATATTTFAPTVLTGIISDPITGLPISGATVVVTDSAGNSYTVTTGSDGRYTVTYSQSTPLAAGPATVSASATGYITATANPTVVAGTTVTQNLALSYVSLSGVVTDLGTGVPVVGATVTFTQNSTVCTTTTGTGGTYSFTRPTCALVAGSSSVTATATSYQLDTKTPTISSTGPTTQNLQLGTVDLVIAKSDGQTVVQPGQTLNYVLTVVNNGSIPAASVTLDDTFPSSYLTFVSDTSGLTRTESPAGTYHWTLGSSLAPGATWSFTVQATVKTSLPDGTTSLSNSAQVSTSSPEKGIANNVISDVDTVTAHPDLTLYKIIIDTTTPVDINDSITYQLYGGNIGHATATDVTIVDTPDSHVSYTAGTAQISYDNGGSWSSITPSVTDKLTFSLANLAPGDTYLLQYTVEVNSIPDPLAPLVNTAAISIPLTEPNTTNNSDFYNVPTSADVHLYLLKEAVPNPLIAVPGGIIHYNLEYGNTGTSAAANVVIEDSLPPNTTLVTGSVTGCSDSGYTLTTTATTVTCVISSLPETPIAFVAFDVTIDSQLPAGTATISNTAEICAPASGSTCSASDPYYHTATVGTPVTARPDLVVTKTDSVTQVLAGDTLNYTITYQNVGNQAATGVTIVDTLLNDVSIDPTQLAGSTYNGSTPPSVYTAGSGSTPATLTWNIGSLTDFTVHTITLTLKVNLDASPGSVVADRVTIADDGANGTDPNPGNNTATDSELVITPYIMLQKHATVPSGNPPGVAYTGQQVTYSIAWNNIRFGLAKNVVIQDTLPDNTSDPTAITGGGTYSSGPPRTITWNLGNQPAGASGTVSFTVTVNPGAGGALQTLPSLTDDIGSGSVTVTSSTTTPPTGSKPYCELDHCAVFKGIYQGANGAPPTGWNDNPRMTVFDDTGWTPPVAPGNDELNLGFWLNPANLSADWVTMHTPKENFGNYSFFRQPFCLPQNATGLSANLQLAGDDVSDIYLNGVYLGQKIGSAAAWSFDGAPGIQGGINILAVQLLNNTHGGHPEWGGTDQSGLLFNLSMAYTNLRPFFYGPNTVMAGQTVTFTADERALGGHKPYEYKFDFGDGTPVVNYQSSATYSHTYSTAGTYTATVAARDADYGCTATDYVVITVLPSGSNLLANPATVTYTNADSQSFSGASGAGLDLRQAADLSITKTDGVSAVNANGMTTYTVRVTNNGPDSVTGAILSDLAVTGLSKTAVACSATPGQCVTAPTVAQLEGGSFALPTLASGQFYEITITATVTATSGSVTNTATITAPAGVTDLTPGNNSASDMDTVTPVADLSITKTAAPDPVIVGNLLTYTLAVNNAGPSAASTLTVTDTLPSGMTFVSVVGTDWTCLYTDSSRLVTCQRAVIAVNTTRYLTLVVSIDATADHSITNSASVSSATFDPDNGNNSSSVTTTVTLSADLSISKTSAATVIAGDNLTYTITITNAGPSAAHNVLATEHLPLGVTFVSSSGCAEGGVPVCTLGTIAAGHSKQYTVTVNVNESTTGSLFNSISVSSETADPNDGNNSTTTIVTAQMGTSSLGSTVFLDSSGNSVQNAGEPGIAGVTVALLFDANTNGVIDGTEVTAYRTLVTDASGNYRFTGLVEGNYQVRIPASNFGTGQPLAGAPTSSPGAPDPDVNATDGDDNGAQTSSGAEVNSPVITLTVGGEPDNFIEIAQGYPLDDAADKNGNMTVDFGFMPTLLMLGGTVWIDSSSSGTNNGVLNAPAEPGVAGVTVELLFDADNNGVIDGKEVDAVSTTVTDASGNYLFTGLAAGNYQVRIPVNNFATGGALASYPQSSSSTDESDNRQDNDDNGSQASSGAVVTGPIINVAVDQEPINTGAENGYGNTRDDADDNNGDLTIDFGFWSGTTGTASLGNLVWYDANNNSAVDGGETGFAGVEVELLNSSGQPVDNPNQSGTQPYVVYTNSSGIYQFTGLPAGVYKVRISQSNFLRGGVLLDYDQSSSITDTDDNQQDNDDNGIQTDGNGTATVSPLITLSENEIDLTIDFGFTIRGTVTTPGSLSYFHAAGDNGWVTFEWATAAEAGNIGFSLLVWQDGEWVELASVASSVIDCVEETVYHCEASGVAGNVFALVDIDRFGEETVHGPFQLNQVYGWSPEEAFESETDWETIRAEYEIRQGEIQKARKAEQQRLLDSQL